MAIRKFSTSSVHTGVKSTKLWDQATSFGSYESISSYKVINPTSEIVFSSIPSTYTHLQIRGVVRIMKTAHNWDSLLFRFNGDTGSNYFRHLVLLENNYANQSYGYTNQTNLQAGFVNTITSTSPSFAPVLIDIPDYSNTSKHKMILSLTGGVPNSTYSSIATGAWANSNAINAIRFFTDSGANIAPNSTLAVYGIKG